MIIQYEEFKRHRKEVTEAKKQKYRFMISNLSEIELSEQLAKYLEKQREQQKYNKINDFIEKKIKKN